MTYLTIKHIKGNPYLYEVRSEREGDRVRQIFVRYLGRADRADMVERRAVAPKAVRAEPRKAIREVTPPVEVEKAIPEVTPPPVEEAPKVPVIPEGVAEVTLDPSKLGEAYTWLKANIRGASSWGGLRQRVYDYEVKGLSVADVSKIPYSQRENPPGSWNVPPEWAVAYFRIQGGATKAEAIKRVETDYIPALQKELVAKPPAVEEVTPEITPEVPTVDEALRRFEEKQKVEAAKTKYGIDITTATEAEYVKAGLAFYRKEAKEIGLTLDITKQTQILKGEYGKLPKPPVIKEEIAPPTVPVIPEAVIPEVKPPTVIKEVPVIPEVVTPEVTPTPPAEKPEIVVSEEQRLEELEFGTKEVPLDILDTFSDLDTLREMRHKLDDGLYLAGDDYVYSVTNHKIEALPQYRNRFDYDKGDYVITERPLSPTNITEVPIFHGSTKDDLNLSDLSTEYSGKNYAGVGGNEFDGLYFTTKPSDAKEWATLPTRGVRGTGNVIEARISPDAKVIKYKEVEGRSTEQLLNDNVDVVLKYGKAGDFGEVIILNPKVLREVETQPPVTPEVTPAPLAGARVTTLKPEGFDVSVGDVVKIGVETPSGRITPDILTVNAKIIKFGHQKGTRKPLVYVEFEHPLSGIKTTQIRLAEGLAGVSKVTPTPPTEVEPERIIPAVTPEVTPPDS